MNNLYSSSFFFFHSLIIVLVLPIKKKRKEFESFFFFEGGGFVLGVGVLSEREREREVLVESVRDLVSRILVYLELNFLVNPWFPES